MKEYPSIASSTGQRFREIPHAYVFDKLDGSNLRIEWSKKQGWHKFGTRTRLFDASDPDFGEAIPIFQRTLGMPMANVLHGEQIDRAVLFCEFWGAKSFAGKHEKGDLKCMTLFDIAVHKRGIVGPKEFLRLTKKLTYPLVPKFLGQFNWTRSFVQEVREGMFGSMVTYEGVVGKAGDGKTHDLVMAKAKTKVWIDAVLSQYGAAEGQKIVES